MTLDIIGRVYLDTHFTKLLRLSDMCFIIISVRIIKMYSFNLWILKYLLITGVWDFRVTSGSYIMIMSSLSKILL